MHTKTSTRQAIIFLSYKMQDTWKNKQTLVLEWVWSPYIHVQFGVLKDIALYGKIGSKLPKSIEMDWKTSKNNNRKGYG